MLPILTWRAGSVAAGSPPVAEAEDGGIRGHDVDDQWTMPPATWRSAKRDVFTET
jgi:hypothetical protein